jgi:phosphoribosylanthranilate isomerase
LREPEHAAVAATAGADLIGFIFAPARRQVSVETARECIAAAREAAGGRSPRAVGVFVDAGPDHINRVVRAAGLDLVQLHGTEPPEVLSALDVPAVKAFRPRAGDSVAAVVGEIDRYLAAERPPEMIFIEGYSERGAGGEGARADWALAAAIGRERPIVLGGGLDPENVATAICQAKPIGVDVSSGVEVGGIKDPARIAAFIAVARRAFNAIGSVPR